MNVMKHNFKYSKTRIFLFFILLFGLAGFCGGQTISAGAPAILEIKFKNGRNTSKGTVSLPTPCRTDITECGQSAMGYFIKGKQGDRITVKLTSTGNKALFSIFTGDHDLLKDAAAVTSWTGILPSDGNFRLTVFTHIGYAHFKLQVRKH